MHHHKLYQSGRWFAVLIALLGVILTGALVVAQDEDEDEDDFVPASIEITGAVNSVDGSLIVVSGLPVDISGVTLEGELTVGLLVTVVGVINEEGIIIAESVTVIAQPLPDPVTPAPEPIPSPTPVDPDVIIVIEGPVTSINVNVIVIHNFTITVAPQNPILNLISIGDIIRVEGALGRGNVINAIVINNVTQAENVAPGASVSVQGPIESINGNIIVVNGITIQLDPSDPRLDELEVGNFIDAQGNFTVINNVYVLVVVNVVIINNTFVGIPPYCHWHGMGGMGRWHCDSYWLYPPGYWYCEWRGMGMGMGMGMGRWECRNPAPAMGMGMGMGR